MSTTFAAEIDEQFEAVWPDVEAELRAGNLQGEEFAATRERLVEAHSDLDPNVVAYAVAVARDERSTR